MRWRPFFKAVGDVLAVGQELDWPVSELQGEADGVEAGPRRGLGVAREGDGNAAEAVQEPVLSSFGAREDGQSSSTAAEQGLTGVLAAGLVDV